MIRTTPEPIGRQIWILVRFWLFGVVGIGLMILPYIIFMEAVSMDRSKIPFHLLPLTIVGTLMWLYGVGRWGHWAYLWVFLSIPISLSMIWLMPGLNGKGSILLVPVPAIIILAAVDAYYAPRVRDERHHDAG